MPTGKVRSDLPVAKIRLDMPTARISSSISESIVVSGGGIVIGNPIGLLLALTYASNVGVTTVTRIMGEGPIVRIRTTD
jgi:xanthine/uracil permease